MKIASLIFALLSVGYIGLMLQATKILIPAYVILVVFVLISIYFAKMHFDKEIIKRDGINNDN